MCLIIAFSPVPSSVLQASLLLREFPGADLVYGHSKEETDRILRFKNSSTGAGEIRDVTGIFPEEAPYLLKRLFCGKRHRFSKADVSPGKYIDFVLRHKSTVPAGFVRFLAECNDPDSLYNRKSGKGKMYYTYMREVMRSYQSLCMFARPEVLENIIVAEINPQHSVADLFCRWLGRRNPDYPVVVIRG